MKRPERARDNKDSPVAVPPTASSYSLGYAAADERLGAASDKQLLLWMRSGDTAAFEQLFARYETRLVAYAARYTGSLDIAKDVCQEVFLKLITRPPRVLICDRLGPWLFRVTRNLAIDNKRRRKFELPELENDRTELAAEGDPLQSVSQKSDAELVRHLVETLPRELRDVVELRIDGGTPFKDIAMILRIPQGTALWRMHRAVEILRQRWQDYERQV